MDFVEGVDLEERYQKELKTLYSGTHWLAEMVWLLNNNLDFKKAREIQHRERVWYYKNKARAMKFSLDNENKPVIDTSGILDFYESLPRTSNRFLKHTYHSPFYHRLCSILGK